MENNVNIVELAKEIATKAHEGQVRRPNICDIKEPYITHLERVVSWLKNYTTDDSVLAAAWLHDTLEDTKYTEDMLKKDGIPDNVIYYVKCLTKDRNIAYTEYISYIKNEDFNVKLIKMADILDNLTDSPSNSQIEKYKKALMIMAL